MAKKKFKFKGHTLEELKKMSMDELVKVMPSRVRRKLRRGFTEQEKKLMRRVKYARSAVQEGKEIRAIRTHCRDMPVLPAMVGMEFEIHNGHEFRKIEIKPEMIGHLLGEFAITRQEVKHSAPGVGATRSSLFVPIR